MANRLVVISDPRFPSRADLEKLLTDTLSNYEIDTLYFIQHSHLRPGKEPLGGWVECVYNVLEKSRPNIITMVWDRIDITSEDENFLGNILLLCNGLRKFAVSSEIDFTHQIRIKSSIPINTKHFAFIGMRAFRSRSEEALRWITGKDVDTVSFPWEEFREGDVYTLSSLPVKKILIGERPICGLKCDRCDAWQWCHHKMWFMCSNMLIVAIFPPYFLIFIYQLLGYIYRDLRGL